MLDQEKGKWKGGILADEMGNKFFYLFCKTRFLHFMSGNGEYNSERCLKIPTIKFRKLCFLRRTPFNIFIRLVFVTVLKSVVVPHKWKISMCFFSSHRLGWLYLSFQTTCGCWQIWIYEGAEVNGVSFEQSYLYLCNEKNSQRFLHYSLLLLFIQIKIYRGILHERYYSNLESCRKYTRLTFENYDTHGSTGLQD